MATELKVHEGDTANWAFTLRRGGTTVNLVGVIGAALTVPFLGILAAEAAMDMDGADGLATYSPDASDTQDKPVYRTPAFIVVTFSGGEVETFPFDITVKPQDYWSRISPTTSTSTSTTTSTTTTTLP